MELADSGGPAVIGFPAVDGVLAVASIPADILNIQKLSRRVSDSPTRRVGESFFDNKYLCKIGTARKIV